VAFRLKARSSLAALSIALTTAGLWQVAAGAAIHAKARLAQYLLQRAWQRTVAGESHVKPWPWADTWPVARLRVPAHDVDLIVLDGVSGRTLAFGPGYATGSARPGSAGVAIVSGHRDTHFNFLARVRHGDEIRIDTADQPPLWFRVNGTGMVDSRRGAIRSAAEQSTLVLITCYPFDAVVPGGPLRWVVLAEREYDEPRPILRTRSQP
jgi:sortase A